MSGSIHYTLITGASKGIGREIAHLLASPKHSKTDSGLILVSRSETELKELCETLQNSYQIPCHYLVADLSQPYAVSQIIEQCELQQWTVTTLINNAGRGLFGDFLEKDWSDHQGMIQLNLTALTELCHRFGQKMKNLGGGQILNIASVAAYQPGPGMAVYYATKAFVLSFSEALHDEMKKDRISVTCLCPGPTQTEFFKSSGNAASTLLDLPWTETPKSVAEEAVKALQKKRRVVISGSLSQFVIQFSHFLPRSINSRVIRLINK